MTDTGSTNSPTESSSSDPGKVLSKFYDIIDQDPFEYGGDAFMQAVRDGDRNTVARFIAETDKFNPFFLCDLADALPEAAARGHEDIVRLLLDEGVTIETFKLCDRCENSRSPVPEGWRWHPREIPCGCSGTALQQASKAGGLSIVALLLNHGADPNFDPVRHGGETALQAASGGGHARVVECLLRAGAKVNAKGSWCLGRTALQAAAADGSLEVLKILLAAGANINAPACHLDGRRALQAAAERGNKEAVVHLLASGADVNTPTFDYCEQSALQAAAKGGHAEIVTVLLAAGADANAAASPVGITALQGAAEGGHAGIVALLLAAGADTNAAGSFYGGTALQAAAKGGHAEIVTVLLAAGADANAATSEGGITALQGAAKCGHAEIVALLLAAGADANAVGFFGYITALGAAAEGGHAEIVEVLLAAGANINDGDCDRSALQTAAEERCAKIETSGSVVGADVNAAASPGGSRALQAAAVGGHADIVATLLTAGADINARDSTRGITALQAAARGGNAETVASLLTAGADINAKSGYDHTTALQAAAERGHTEIVTNLLAAGADVNPEAHNCDITAKFLHDCSTPLQAAAKGGHADIVAVLLAAGADINVRAAQRQGRTALQAAAGEGHSGIVTRLLAAGADINAKPGSIGGRTALQAAAEGGYEEIVASLLNAGADANAKPAASSGITALEGAVKGGHVKIVASLLSLGTSIYNRPTASPLTKIALSPGQSTKGPIRAPGALSTTDSFFQKPSAPKDNLPAVDPGSECLIWSIGQPKVLQFLLQAGINTDVSSADGSSPLHCAVKKKVMRSASLLLLSGVDTSTRDPDNRTAFDLLKRSYTYSQPQWLWMFLLLGYEIRGLQIHLWYEGYKKSTPGSFLTLTALPIPQSSRIPVFSKEQPHQSGKSGKVSIQITLSDHLPDVGPGVDGRRLYQSRKDIEELLRKPRYIVANDAKIKFKMVGDRQAERKVSCIRHWRWHRVDTGRMDQEGIDLPSHMKMDTTGIVGALLTCSVSFDYLTLIAGRTLEAEDGANAFKVSAHKSTVSWTMHKASPVSDEELPPILKTIEIFSTLDIGWVPGDAVDFFTSYVVDLHKKWRVLLEEAVSHLDNSRKILLKKQGKSTGFIEILLLDAQTWSDSQSLLQTQVRTARDILTDFRETKYLQDEIVDAKAALDHLSGTIEGMEQEVLKEINDLDNKTQKMIELEFNLVSIYESRTSKEMGMSMKRLSWITFVFLPLMFVASLFGMNIDIISGGPEWTWVIILAVCLFTVVLVVWVLLKCFPIDEWIREHREKVKTARLKGNTQREWYEWGYWRNKECKEDLESGEAFQFTRPKRRWTMKLKDH